MPQPHTKLTRDEELLRYINLKLAAVGEPSNRATADPSFMEIVGPLLRNHLQKDELLGWPLCPVDLRIQAFLDTSLKQVCPDGVPTIPSKTFVLDRPGLGRMLSLPPSADHFESPYVTSYRVQQGVLHNPKSDRRTTQGVFHVVEGGLPISNDKLAVPKQTFARLLKLAWSPPSEALMLPFTSDQTDLAHLFVSLLLRPLVCPATDREPEKSMEIRFFAPGTLVSNLDFVESIFGNGGDPFLPENDAALDVMGWTGHTGCVILAPHLVGLLKKALGLPRADQATDRQHRDGMCWKEEHELYNEGRPFKISCRDRSGVMVTIIADNYYGYCKKEVKTQVSYAANLYGGCEEEHSGGALAFPSYVLGQVFYANRSFVLKRTTFEQAMQLLGDRVHVFPERYAVDKNHPSIFYVPEDAEFSVEEAAVRWPGQGAPVRLSLRESEVYVLPSGYAIRLEKQDGGNVWQLVGSRADGVFCHKPCTVSGGGKSEISKSLKPMIHPAPIFVKDYEQDLERVDSIIQMDFARAYRREPPGARAKRGLLSPERSLGSVIQLLTPSERYTDAYNAWVRAIPQTIRQLVFILKRFYLPEWGENWREHFSVDRINGFSGHELKFEDQRLVGGYLRVGFEPGGLGWRMYKLRPDFSPADKVQMEDDITVSVVVPRERVTGPASDCPNPSLKLVANCEQFLFQRPDDAVHRGFDLQAESDLATPGTFITNFEPLSRKRAQELVDRVTEFDRYSPSMKALFQEFLSTPSAAYLVSSAHARLVDGTPSKNPRYLQRRPDQTDARGSYLAEVQTRLHEEVPAGRTVHFAVHSVLAGRRASPPQPELDLPPLAVFNPIHYQELPELFMDFLSSLTGKSPSTTGFGSEGALTKGPFNALWPVVDVNNALVSAILTGYAGFTSAAGNIGPGYRVGHDVSMLVPEIWCRMRIKERDPVFLIEHGYLEKLEDFEFEGRTVLASRLGYRITAKFADHFLGRIFETPGAVFTDPMLRPELQGLSTFVAGVDAIVQSQTRVAESYFADGSVEAACPPLKALLHIMARGSYQGLGLNHPEIRALFGREEMLRSDWYQLRLSTRQERVVLLWKRHLASLESHRARAETHLPDLDERFESVRKELERALSPSYLAELVGTLGADPFQGQLD